MVKKCRTCKMWFNDIDGVGGQWEKFICANCLRSLIDRPVTPKKRRWWHFLLPFAFLFIIFLLPTTQAINITAPGNTTFDYDGSGSEPFICLENPEAPSQCSVDISIDSGTTYSNNGGSCDLKLKCLEPELDDDYENVTHKFRFRFEKGLNNFSFYSFFTNKTETYNTDETPLLDREYTVSCPELIDRKKESCFEFDDINLTDEEQYLFITNPGLKAMAEVRALSFELVDLQQNLSAQCDQTRNSNFNLAEENARLSEENSGYRECKTDLFRVRVSNENMSARLIRVESDLSAQRSRADLMGTYSAIASIVTALWMIFFFTRRKP